LDRIIHKQSIIYCKYCNSKNIVKYGTFQGMQRYFCKSCRRKFADNDAIPRMKTPIWIISLALSCYYDGMPLSKIQKEINQRHGAYYAQSSIYNWIIRFSVEAVRQAEASPPAVSDRWLLCITPVTAGIRRFWFFDIFDIDSQFLLATQLSQTGTEPDVIYFLDTIHNKTRKTLNHPVTIFVPENIYSFHAINKIEESKKAEPYWLVKAAKSRTDEYLKLLKRRNNIVRSYKDFTKTQILMGAWQVHYNFLSEYEPTRHTPPAKRAAIVHFKSWTDIINQSTK
jgi:putative transposase